MEFLRSILSAALLLSLAACDDEPVVEPVPITQRAPTPAPAAEPAAAPEPVRTHMREHFRFARAARTGLIRGDIEATKAAMQELARLQTIDGLPANLEPMLPPLRAAAAGIESAHTLREAGVAVAKTLVACSACHQRADTGPNFAIPPLPEGDTVQIHMQRHRWAADRLWEGLVQPSDEVWNSGADALSDSRLDPADLDIPDELRGTAAALVQHVYDLGEQAKSATTPDARADVFGHFIATCATCHRLVHGGPDPDSPPGE
ncbi:MAG: hypothetical protein GXP55_04725 [Deltaproteobacteria bacterium]|nr:hypothetical protein [Deltaproteobacteria bacterium]